MKLVYGELKTSLDQSFTIPTNGRLMIERIRPHLLIRQPGGNITGTLTLSVLNSLKTITYGSKIQTLAAIRSAGSTLLQTNHYHGNISFIFDTPLLLQAGTYFLRLAASGSYTFSQNDHIGWVKEHENLTITPSGVAENDTQNPYSFEITTYKNR